MQKRFNWKDAVVLLGVACFFFSCIASSHRSPQVMRPGQISVGGSYLQASSTDNDDADPIRLIGADARVGVFNGLDLGVGHSFDITEDSEKLFSTFWGDLRYQVLNKGNEVMKPILTLGLMKGFVYKEDADLQITTFPIQIGLPINDKLIPFFIYRYEVFGDEFIPEFEDPRHTFAIGAEFSLVDPAQAAFIPKIGVSIGTFNSIIGGGEDDKGIILNIGVSVDTNR